MANTPEGKAISSQNAVQHGLYSAYIYVPVGLEPQFEDFHKYYTAAFLKPNSSAAQQIMWDQLVRAGWIIERIQLALVALERDMPYNDPISQWDHDKLQKHLTKTEISYRFYLKQLQAIQNNEMLAQTTPELADQKLPSLVNPKHITRELKRTLKLRAEKPVITAINGV